MMMDFSTYWHPTVLQDTPRLFTAIAEWAALMVYFRIYKKRSSGVVHAVKCLTVFLILALLQLAAGLLPLVFWIPAMLCAVGVMFASLYWGLQIRVRDCGVLTIHAFILAELSASLSTQLYVWTAAGGIGIRQTAGHEILMSVLIMCVVYVLVDGVYYYVEKENIPSSGDLNISAKELISVISTGIMVFLVSNISFVNTRTPFSSSDSILYVRTLVDFCGMLILMTQMERRNEFALREEREAVNQLLQRQYEQYRLAIDNAEMLRREMHDMKHYVIALKHENDPDKRAVVLGEMEQAIAIQESFMNTGNKVLDVILTTKSLQCKQKGISLSVMAEGDCLGDLFVKDICSLFGNLLDNAIEAVQQVKAKDKRLINLTVRKRGGFIVIECENCCEGKQLRVAKGQDGHDVENIKHSSGTERPLPKTTKKDSTRHGYGLKSIEQAAEKYNGTMTWSLDNDWFKVKVLLSVSA